MCTLRLAVLGTYMAAAAGTFATKIGREKGLVCLSSVSDPLRKEWLKDEEKRERGGWLVQNGEEVSRLFDLPLRYGSHYAHACKTRAHMRSGCRR
jgi:hypothetical protein